MWTSLSMSSNRIWFRQGKSGLLLISDVKPSGHCPVWRSKHNYWQDGGTSLTTFSPPFTRWLTSSQTYWLLEAIRNRIGFHISLVTLKFQIPLVQKMTILNWWSLSSLSFSTFVIYAPMKTTSYSTYLATINAFHCEVSFRKWILRMKKQPRAQDSWGCIPWARASLQLQRKYVIWKCLFSIILYLENKYSLLYKQKDIRLDKIILV